MADELNPDEAASSPETPPAQDASPENAGPSPAPAPKSPAGGGSVMLSFLFVALSAAGVISYAAEVPEPWLLGLGLLGWGLMDLYSSRKGSTKAGLAKGLNLFRGLFFTALGTALLLAANGLIPAISSNSLLLAGVSFISGYLLAAYSLELGSRNTEMMPHALLQASLLLQFASFLYFSVPFTVGVAGVLSFAAFGCLGLASWRGVMSASPALAPGLGLVTIVMGLPFFIFFAREVMMTDLQPVVQTSLFMPRYYELQQGLTRDAGNLAWAPGNAQVSNLGDVRFSDKLAWMDRNKEGKTLLKVYLQGEKQSSFAETPMAAGSQRPWWAPSTLLLAATGNEPGPKAEGTLSLYHWENEVGKAGDMRRLKGVKTTLKGENVFPHEAHGQIWSPDGSGIYFAAPKDGYKKGRSAIWRASTSQLSKVKLTKSPSKIYPAASPDASKVADVATKENFRYFEIGDTEAGLNRRLFRYQDEAGLFPAWNKSQDQVLFVDRAGKLKITSSNNRADARDFGPGSTKSRVWRSEETKKLFTLEMVETGERRQVWTMNPDGSGNTMIYESAAAEIIAPIWTGDSSRIAFIERDEARYHILTMYRDGTWPRRCFTTKDKLRSLSWSPDSQRAAWFADRHKGKRQEVWMVERDSMNPELLYSGRGNLESLTWSPQGQHLAFEEKSAWKLFGIRLVRPDIFKVLMVDIKDRRARPLTVAGQNARQPAVSPQGDMVAFVADQATFSWIPGIWTLSLSPKRPAALAVAQLF